MNRNVINTSAVDVEMVAEVFARHGRTFDVPAGEADTPFEYKGAVSETPRRFTRFFVKQSGKWVLVGQHVTAIAER
jgi:hypothetical protein